MSTRTSIRIGTLVDDAMKQRLPGYKRILEEYTNQSLLFGYRKPVMGHYYATILFQASKEFGGITCEVGVSRNEDFPYYRFFDRPQLGVHGFRARTRHLLNGLDASTTRMYTGPESLTGAILELVAEASSATERLLERALPRVSQEYNVWQPLYAEWQEAEKSATQSPDLRYRYLVGEAIARKILHSCLQSGRYDSYMGPRKFRYREPDFLNCHVYLLARALSFIEPPEPDDVARMVLDPSAADPDKVLFDPIASLTGRTEQDEAVELPEGILQRVPHWAFLRSFAALEAFFENPVVSLDEVKTSVKEPTPLAQAQAAAAPQAGSSGPIGLSLDDLYADAPVLEELPMEHALSDSLESLEPLAAAPRAQLRPDPFELMAPFLETEKAKAPAVDPFDMLGSQFGLG